LGFVEYVIPFERIAQLATGPQIIILLAIVAVSIVILTSGAGWLVDGSAALAYRLGISKIIVGATVVSLGTTTPEAAVSVMAAMRGHSGLALGNALGSVICDTGLIFGLACLLTRLPVDRFILNRHGWLQFGSGILLAVTVLASVWYFGRAELVRPVGVVFLALLVGYLFMSIRWGRGHPSRSADTSSPSRSVPLCLIMIVAALVLVVVGARVLICAVTQICLVLAIPESVIAATVVAFGTSVPELVTALTSIRKGHPEILIGNIIGADILNILFVVGASATAVALPVPREVIWIHVPAMLLILLLFRIFIFTSKTSFSRWCGLPLLVVYAGFVVVSYFAGQLLGLSAPGV